MGHEGPFRRPGRRSRSPRVLAREGNEPGLVFHHRGDMTGRCQILWTLRSVSGHSPAGGHSFEPVPQEELSLVPVVPVRDFDEGEAPVGELKEELQLPSGSSGC